MGRLLPYSFLWQENQQCVVNNFLVLRLNAQKHEPECSNVVSSLSRTDQGTENTDHMSFNQFDVVQGFSDHHYADTSAGKHFEKLQDRLENQEAEREAEREEHRCQIQEMKLAMQRSELNFKPTFAIVLDIAHYILMCSN